jgi:hypothetical protein
VYLVGDLLPHSDTHFKGCKDATTSTIGTHWPLLAWIGAGLAGFLFLVSLVLPKTPVFRAKQAEGDAGVEEGGGARLADLKHYKKTLTIGWGMLIFQQISGINAVIFFGTSI